MSYDHELQALQELIQQSVTTLLSDPVNAVKQTLLERGIRRLCVFFGRQKGMTHFLLAFKLFSNRKNIYYDMKLVLEYVIVTIFFFQEMMFCFLI